MKTFEKLFYRPNNRAQPICNEGRNGKCQFLFHENELFGCKAGGVHSTWAVKESSQYQNLFLTTFEKLLKYRNFRINICPYWVRQKILLVLSSFNKRKNGIIVGRTVSFSNILKFVGVEVLILVLLYLIIIKGWNLNKVTLFGLEFGQPSQTVTPTAIVVTSTPTFWLPTPTTTLTMVAPTPILPDLEPITSLQSELTFCSADLSRHAGIRIIAQWLVNRTKKGFLVAAQEGTGIVEYTIRGLDYSLDIVYPLEKSQTIGKCGYTDIWWFGESIKQNPTVGEIIQIELFGVGKRLLATIELSVEQERLKLIAIHHN